MLTWKFLHVFLIHILRLSKHSLKSTYSAIIAAWKPTLYHSNQILVSGNEIGEEDEGAKECGE